MASLNEIIKNSAQNRAKVYSLKPISYTQLRPSDKNRYSTDNIRELADMIALAGGIKQNLVVRKVDAEEYTIIAGHRRCLAAKMLVEEDGLKEYEYLPCLVERLENAAEEFDLITINSTQRERTDQEKAHEVARLQELLPQMKGLENIKARVLRALIAQATRLSETKVAQIQAINNNLIPALREKFDNGDIKFSAAYELSGLTQEEQEKIAETENEIRHKAVKEIKNVSESDTAYDVPEEVSDHEFLPGPKSHMDPYDAEQRRLDRENKKKLEEIEDEEKMRHLPSDTPREERWIRISKEQYQRIQNHEQSYIILKRTDIKQGDAIVLEEYHKGHATGRRERRYVSYMDTEETSSALMEGFSVLNITEEKL